MKLTVESTPTTATITVELNGDTFRQTWVANEIGLLETEDNNFLKMAESTGKYDDFALLSIGFILDNCVSLLALQTAQLAENCEGCGDA